VLRAGLFDIVRLDAPRQSASWRRCEEARGRCELATLLGAGVRTGAPADLVYAIARREIAPREIGGFHLSNAGSRHRMRLEIWLSHIETPVLLVGTA